MRGHEVTVELLQDENKDRKPDSFPGIDDKENDTAGDRSDKRSEERDHVSYTDYEADQIRIVPTEDQTGDQSNDADK